MTDKDLPMKDPNGSPEDEPGFPHFQRRDGRYIDYHPDPDDEKFWKVLPYLPDEELRGLGLQPWGDDGEVWLFPVEWYSDIPEGLEITTISERTREFDRDEDSKEARGGALPYGVSRPYFDPDEEDKPLVPVDDG